MFAFISPIVAAALACGLVVILSLAVARSAGAAGRAPTVRLATFIAAVAFVPIPGISAIALLATVLGHGAVPRLLALTTIPLAVAAIVPLARWLYGRAYAADSSRRNAVAPYAAVDTGLPVSYWAIEAAAVFALVAAVGLTTERLLGDALVLVCGMPVAVALPALLRATLAPRMARRRLSETTRRRSAANTAELADPTSTGAPAGDRLADVRHWTAQLAQEHGCPAPAVVVAPHSATYLASSDRSNSVIVIDDQLFRVFETSELHAVMAHEIAHLVRNERLRRAMTESLVVARYLGVMLAYSYLRGPISGSYVIVLLITYAYVRQAVDRWSIRRGEFSADLTAAQWLGDARPMISALQTIARVRGVPLARRLGHRPSFGERITALAGFRVAAGEGQP
ncbi:MAG: M48 family metalloprotease [bacterium]